MACCLNGARTVTTVGHTLNPRRHLRIVAMRNKRLTVCELQSLYVFEWENLSIEKNKESRHEVHRC